MHCHQCLSGRPALCLMEFCAILCRPDTPDVASDLTPRIVSSSGRSSTLSSEFPYETPKASSPPDDRQALQEPCASPLPRPPQNPFAAAAMASASFTDVSDTESESHFSTPRSSFDLQDPRHSASHASSRRPARAVPKSPKSPGRAHAHQPLDESEGEKSLLAKLSMMERTHSAPGAASPRNLFVRGSTFGESRRCNDHDHAC